MADDPLTRNDYRCAEWRYSVERRLLIGPDTEVRLKPLLDRLLRRLMDEPGSMLLREQLIAEVWTRREVNDEVLSRAIAELRALLGDDARSPKFIETLPKGGYRWIAPVVRDADIEHAKRGSHMLQRYGWRAAVLVLFILLAGVFWLVGTDGRSDRSSLAMDLLRARPIATDSRLEYDARFDTPARVVYIRSDQTSDFSELVMLDTGSLAERVLWRERASLRHPTPAPNGGEIAVMRKTGQSCELWSVSVVDARRNRLGDCSASAADGMEWVDGGDALLYTGPALDEMHAPGLMVLDRRSNKHRRLTTPAIHEGAHVAPRVSADGRVLVYASQHGSDRQLWRTDWPLLQHSTALLKRPEPVYGHAFMPLDDSLWIAGDLLLYRALHRLPRDGVPELIGGRGARSIDLASNGAAVWSEAIYDADIHLQSGIDAPPMAIARSNRYESQPEFSPDGTRLALTSNRNGAESVFVHDLTDGSTRALSLNSEFRWVRPTWSSRDQSLILTAYENQQTRLYRYQLDGDILTSMPEIKPGAFHGVELADRLLYLSGHGAEESTLMQQPSGSSQAFDLGLGSVAAFRASSKWLVWRTARSNDLLAAPLATLQSVRQVPRESEGTGEAFALAGDSVYFLDQGSLWSVELPNGQPVELSTQHLPSASGPNLAVSSKGAVAVAMTTSLSIDLMILDAPAPDR